MSEKSRMILIPLPQKVFDTPNFKKNNSVLRGPLFVLLTKKCITLFMNRHLLKKNQVVRTYKMIFFFYQLEKRYVSGTKNYPAMLSIMLKRNKK